MRTVCMLLVSMAFSCAWGQQNPAASPPTQTPQASSPPEQLEPAVDTSAPAPSAAPTRQGAASASASPNSDAGKPQAARRGTQPPKAGAPAAKGPDRVQLETTDITGNRELPKVLYIVPWKRSDLGDLVGKPPNSLLDEVLQPIDRDVFMRENRYYDALKPDAGRPGRGALPAAGEKP